MITIFNHYRQIFSFNKCNTPLFFLLLFIFTTAAASSSYQNRLIVQAIENKLYKDPSWLVLLHYRNGSLLEGYRSQADNPDFFFSPQGVDDPKSELIATIKAMFLPDTLSDRHPQCRFPARFAWLNKELKIDSSKLPDPECACLNDWKQQLNADQAAIVFPASYLNNPSSMFGHLFLRFESTDGIKNNLLMSYIVNFAADTSTQEGTIDYIYKGLSGGFPSATQIQRFYERYKMYSDIENRDIWEYRLNLTQAEVDQLILHTWELRNNVFDYYFFDENCAYRLLALLDVARPELDLSGQFTAYTIPADVIRALKERGAIQSTTYRPSAAKTFYRHSDDLSDTEAQLVVELVRKQLPPDDPKIQGLPPERRALVLTLSSEYLALLINKDVIDRKMSAELTLSIFAERIHQSYAVGSDSVPEPSTSPDNGHKAHRVSLGVGRNENDNFFLLGFREAYHSLLDPLPGFEKGAQIDFFDLVIRAYDENNKIELEKCDIVSITSLTPVNMFFKPASWNLSLGAHRRALYNERVLIALVEASVGVTVGIGEHLLSALAYCESAFSEGLDESYGVAPGLNLNLVYQSDNYSYDFGVLSMKYFIGDNLWYTRLWGKMSFPLRRNNAIYSKFEYTPSSKSSSCEISFGFSRYF